ncbi:MAG: hypothetical protein LBR84_02760 [Tannerella sp.]|jgi:hypothetical protein|nr:hypothetical protein [Tannerella sp.]
MENLGDYFYIILLVIAGISSVIGSVGKNRKKAAERGPGEVIFEPAEPRPKPFVERPVQPKPRTKPQKRQPQILESIDQTYTSLFPKQEEATPILAVEEERAVVTIDDLPVTADDWCKAFVYNEIFNRKY